MRILTLLAMVAFFTPSPLLAYDYAWLQGLVNDNNVTSVEELVELLPDELKKNYTLVWDSGSLQSADKLNPRAVLFAKDGHFTLTFNGDPKQTGYHSVELMQFNNSSKRFEFARIDFEDQTPEFSEMDPKLCKGCHGKVMRPIWPEYANWRGVYGYFHDQLTPSETRSLKKYRDHAKNHPRYKHLVTKSRSSVFPYFTPNSRYFNHLYRPNTRLSNFYTNLQVQQILPSILESKNFNNFKYRLLLNTMKCQGATQKPINDSIAEDFENLFPEKDHRLLYSDLSTIKNQHNRNLFMLEKIISGLDVYAWGLIIGPRRDGLRDWTGTLTIDEILSTFIFKKILEDQPELAPYLVPVDYKFVYRRVTLEGYYEAYVAPGGYGNIYDRQMSFSDIDTMKQTCVQMQQLALEESK